jgi:hypothetical protein
MSRLITTDHEREVTRRCNDRKITGDELELIGLLSDYNSCNEPARCGALWSDITDSLAIVESDNEARRVRISGELSDERTERGCRPSEAAE